MKRELLDLARERKQESVSKWAVTDRGILALLAEGPLLHTSHSFPPLKIPDLLMDFQIKWWQNEKCSKCLTKDTAGEINEWQMQWLTGNPPWAALRCQAQ